MLFDLRSRGRRRTVRGVYLGLAILMGGGLVLFGVGTGVGGGGLLNAFGGGSSNQNQVVSQQEKTALRETQVSPNDPQSWYDLVEARWTNAGQGTNFNSSRGTFTAAGQKELTLATQDWQRYLQLTKHPDPSLAVLAARAYAALGEYGQEASAWDVETLGDPSAAKGFECLAVSAYAAKQAREGALASAKALSMLPVAQKTSTKQLFSQAQRQPQAAQEIATQEC